MLWFAGVVAAATTPASLQTIVYIFSFVYDIAT
jgi:hypothetical protein